MVLLEDEGDPVLKLIMVTSRKDDNFLQIREFPTFHTLYELKVSKTKSWDNYGKSKSLQPGQQILQASRHGSQPRKPNVCGGIVYFGRRHPQR